MSGEEGVSLTQRFEKVFSNDKSEPDNSGGVSTIDKIRGDTKAELGRVAATIAEGTAYGAYDPSSGRITSSLTKPKPLAISQIPNEPPNKRRAAAPSAKKSAGSTSAGPSKSASAAAEKASSELASYRALRRLENYKRLFKKRSMRFPPVDENKPVEACRVCEEELKIMATPDIGDRVLLGTLARVEAIVTSRPQLEERLPIRGLTAAVDAELDTYLRDDLDELYIKYDAALALSVEARVGWRLMDIAYRVAARNSSSTPMSRQAGEVPVDPDDVEFEDPSFRGKEQESVPHRRQSRA